MSIMEIAIYTFEGIKIIFTLGFLPKKSEFFEFTANEYKCYKSQIKGFKRDEKIFQLIPTNYKYLKPGNNVSIFSEETMNKVLVAVCLVKRYCDDSKKIFLTDEAMINYCASLLPNVLSDGTKFEQKKLTLLKNSEEISKETVLDEYMPPKLQVVK